MNAEPPTQIPIQNLYYLLCYAWDQLDQGSIVDVSRLPTTELVDLFATVLIKGFEHLLRRGLAQDYNEHDEELRGIRGRIDVLVTARRFLDKHGRAACRFDELTINTLANQIIKATFKGLLNDPNLDTTNRKVLRSCITQLQGVNNIRVSAQSFRRIQIHGNNRFYRFLLNVCEFVHGAWLAEQESGPVRFREFVRNERKMAYVFQHFVFNFLRHERRDLDVRVEHISWKASSVNDPSLSLLPRMETDISVFMPGRKIIIDTKYYRETLSEYHGSEKVRSENLYQMMSYLLNSQNQDDESIEGILLYPAVDLGRPVHSKYTILKIPVRIETIDLTRPWREIHDQLITLVEPLTPVIAQVG